MIIRDLQTVEYIVKMYKKMKRAIVMTGGVFDLIHYGHIASLQEALQAPRVLFGDNRKPILVVAMNTDFGAISYKRRPIVSQEIRAWTLDDLGVDIIVPFPDPTPVRVIRAVCPHYYTKGQEYNLKDLPERELLELLRVQYFSTRHVVDKLGEVISTTNIIKKVKEHHGEKER